MSTALRRQNRNDANHKRLRAFWRGLPHATWLDLVSTEIGMPDALIGTGGRDQLIEIKQPGRDPDPEQIAWAREWRGSIPLVVRTTDDLKALYRAMRRMTG